MTQDNRLRLVEFVLDVRLLAAVEGRSVTAADLVELLALGRKIHALSLRQSNSPNFGAGDANRRGRYVNRAVEIGMLWGAMVEPSFDPRGLSLTLLFPNGKRLGVPLA